MRTSKEMNKENISYVERKTRSFVQQRFYFYPSI